ncbi:MAG TPA: FliM/FliN family flagellar motor switch protein [Rectinemataceae bacterium]|nr:FliM/FliN family flagellar motor switch protein [Rectinemataceae bacterium]
MKTGTIDDVQVRLEVVLGEASLSVKELASLRSGRIVELESICGEPVELRASGQLVARGEVVVLDEKFGIRVTELAGTGAHHE